MKKMSRKTAYETHQLRAAHVQLIRVWRSRKVKGSVIVKRLNLRGVPCPPGHERWTETSLSWYCHYHRDKFPAMKKYKSKDLAVKAPKTKEWAKPNNQVWTDFKTIMSILIEDKNVSDQTIVRIARLAYESDLRSI